MAPPLSLAAQDAALRADWPSIRPVLVGDRLGLWRGWIVAFSKPYLIEIRYVMNGRYDPCPLGGAWFPEVRVLEPRLAPSARAPGQDIPHVYADPDAPDDLVLCLFDPRADGWSRRQTIASTIVPWTASWLRFYEIWRATGEWHGGGVDHAPLTIGNDAGPAPEPEPEDAGSEAPAGPGRARAASYQPAASAFWRQWRPDASGPPEVRLAA